MTKLQTHLTPKKRTSIGSRRSPEAEAAVLSAARELIGEKGYAGFSIEEVARRAGSGKTTIYRWYPTKADLFIAIYAIERTASVTVPDTGRLLDDLIDYTTSLWLFWRSNAAGAALRGLIAEAQGTREALAVLRDRFFPERTADVKRILERAASRGEIAVDEVSDKLSLWVGYSWLRLLTHELHDEGPLASVMAQIVGVTTRS
jgi:AcrR family transcriptional regulator